MLPIDGAMAYTSISEARIFPPVQKSTSTTACYTMCLPISQKHGQPPSDRGPDGWMVWR